MAPDPYSPNEPDHKFGQSIQEVTERLSLLMREEIELAKAEVEVKAKSLARGAAIGAAAGVFAVVGVLFLLFGVAFLWFDYVFDHISFGFFITAVILFVLGGLAGFAASKLFKKGAPPTPDLAIEEAKRIRATVTEGRTTPLPEATERTN